MRKGTTAASEDFSERDKIKNRVVRRPPAVAPCSNSDYQSHCHFPPSPSPPFTPLLLLAAAFVVASLRRALAAAPFKCRRTRLKYAKLLEHLVSKALTPSASRATSYQLWGLCDSGDSAATIGHSGLPICGCTCSSCQAKLPVLVAHNVYLSLSLSVSVCVCAGVGAS